MKVLVLGASGQLGSALCGALAGQELLTPSHSELNICDYQRVDSYIQSHRPGLVINTAAFTHVDHAEDSVDAARLVNAGAVEGLVSSCGAIEARFIQVSTDYVFNGESSSPYKTSDCATPLNVYGVTKREGELYALEYERSQVVRTSWLYSAEYVNFVTKMLALMSTRNRLEIVADQVGAPTHVGSLAQFISRLIACEKTGIFHWSDEGAISWFQFAQKIQEFGLRLGLLTRKTELMPVSSEQFASRAKRPKYSALDLSESISALDIEPVFWENSLFDMLCCITLEEVE